MYQKIKRILALLAVTVILLLYASAFIFAFIKGEQAGNLLMTAIVASIVIPVLFYIYLWLFRLFNRHDDDEA